MMCRVTVFILFSSFISLRPCSTTNTTDAVFIENNTENDTDLAESSTIKIFSVLNNVTNGVVTKILNPSNVTGSDGCQNSNDTINVKCQAHGNASPKSKKSRAIDYVGYVAVPVLLVMGICGNILIVVFMRSKYFRHLQMSIILTALALSDSTLIILFPFNKSFTSEILGFDVRALSSFGCKAYYFFYRSAKISSSWLVVLISVERFLAVWFPIQVKLLSTNRTVIIAIVVIFISDFILNGVWTMTTVLENGVCVANYRLPNKEGVTEAFILIGTIVFSVIPTLILIVLTPLTIWKLYKETQKRKRITNEAKAREKSRSTTKTTAMLLGVTTAYVILVGPISTVHSVAYFTGENLFMSQVPLIVTFREVAQVMEQMNYAVNFILYVGCCKTFRDGILIGLGCRKRMSSSKSKTKGTSVENPEPTK